MAILPWPTGVRNPSSVGLALVANTQSGGRSPFDGTEQTLELPGSRWSAEIRWNRLAEREWRIMQAFVASLGGQAGRFLWGPTHMPRRGTRGGTAQVFGGAQTGRSLVTGFWSGTGLAFEVGDLVGWTDPAGREVFHMVTANVAVDGSNAATVPLAPPIRRSPTTGTVLNLTAPKAVWRLVNDATGLEYERGVFAALSLTIEEAIF